MELKYEKLIIINSAAPRFNRTFMELKLRNAGINTAMNGGFNRTFMELKYYDNVTYTYHFWQF